MRHLVISLSIASTMLMLFAQQSFAGGCGCETACKPCKSCKQRCCCPTEERAAPPRTAYAPRAAVVDSMPVFQMTPGVIAMPMMMGNFRQASFEEPRSREPDCSSSKSRMDALEDKVEALDLRMQTIQRSVEIQTRILEEMKAERIFPQRYLPAEGAAKP